MNADLLQTAKAALQQLKQDPAGLKQYPFGHWISTSINLLDQANKLEPQDAHNGMLEENKDDGLKPPLVTMVVSYVDIKNAVKQQKEQDLAKVQQMLQELSKGPKMEPANHFLKAPKALKNSYNSDFMSVTVKMEQELA